MLTTDDGTRLWTATGGRGTHLALAHGGPGLWDYLGPLAAQLEPLATVHRWDQRGGGRSDHRGPYTVDRCVADMEAVRAAAGAERWVAGGHSWGGSLALAYALAYPDRVLGVLYVAGIGLEWQRWVPRFREERRRRLEALGGEDLDGLPPAEANLRRWTADLGRPEAGAAQVRHMLDAGFAVNPEANEQLQRDFDGRAAGLAERLRRLDRPVLVVQGALDPRPVQAVDTLVDLLPPGRVRRVVVAGAGHFPWAEEPDLVRGEIARWLGQLR
jgi:proline iminopeptidase